MLNHIPSRWPRTFTVVGVGLALLKTVLEIHFKWIVNSTFKSLAVQLEETKELVSSKNAVGLEQIKDIEAKIQLLASKTSFDFLEHFLVSTDQGILWLYAIFTILIAYFFGEMALAICTQITRSKKSVRERWAKRVAQYSKCDNPLMNSSYERHLTTVDSMMGLLAIMVTVLLQGFFNSIFEANYFPLFFYLFVAITTPWVILGIVKNIEESMDAEISEFIE